MKITKPGNLEERIKILEKKVHGLESRNKIENDVENKVQKAIELTKRYPTISASLIQRKLQVGYARAAFIIDQLMEKGYLNLEDISKPVKRVIKK